MLAYLVRRLILAVLTTWAVSVLAYVVIELPPGLHLLSNSNLNDHSDERQEFVRRLLTLQRLDSAVAFLAFGARMRR